MDPKGRLEPEVEGKLKLDLFLNFNKKHGQAGTPKTNSEKQIRRTNQTEN